jgi:hypothetical protein
MKTKKIPYAYLALFLVLMISVKLAGAATSKVELTADDFAYGLQITPADKSAIQYFSIPFEVYTGLTRADRRDIRLYDARGRSVPWMIDRASSETRIDMEIDAPFFPIHAAADKKLDDLSLKIQRNTDGTLIDIQASDAAPETGATTLKKIAYILDMQAVYKKSPGVLHSLKFDWRNEASDNIWQINMEAGDDLEKWSSVVSGAALTRLDYAGNTLRKNTVLIDGTNKTAARFFRISWSAEHKPLELERITANFRHHETEMIWREFEMSETEPDDKKMPAGFTFTTGGYVPVEKIAFEFSDENALYKGAVYSRANDNQDWIPRGRFLQYRLQMAEAVINSDAESVSRSNDPQWLLQFDEPRDIRADDLPRIKIGWVTERIRFLAVGEAPYTLAYGSAAVNDETPGVGSSDGLHLLSIRENLSAVPAEVGQPIELGGESKRLPGTEPWPWRKIALWMILIAGVGLMGWMVRSLYKQMN